MADNIDVTVNGVKYKGLVIANPGSSGGTTPTGSQPTANSVPVNPATDSAPFPVSATALPLPAGASTSANQTGTGAAAQTVQGNVASGAVDAGSPVKVGGVVAPISMAAATIGNRSDLVLDSYGNLRVRLVGGSAAAPIDTGTTSVGVAVINGNSTASAAPLNMLGYVWNGTNVITARGDANGSFSVAKGGTNLNTAQVSVGTTATQILAARVARGAVTVTNTGTTDVFLGGAGVTATTGTLLPGTKGASVTIPFNGALFGIVATGTQTVSAYEVY